MLRQTTLVLGLVVFAVTAAEATDIREISNGLPIPDEGYCDQPYVVITADGDWLCTLTTGTGREGDGGQHVVSTISSDQGRTWSRLVDIEPSTGPAASWAVPLITPSGRIYVFYTYNGDEVDLGRNDVHGWYAMKYSDDGGRSWSQRRYRLPLRPTACDRLVMDGQPVQMFWGIDKPTTSDGTVYFAFTKLGRYFLQEGEGWLFVSDNILSVPDPADIHWELRPDGDSGIRRAEYGTTQEEHNLVPLGGQRLYCVYRTTKGFACHVYSEDGGRTWTEPQPMTYQPNGRVVRNPRACPKLWKCDNGKYLFWYHLHGGTGFQGRNPAWVIGGIVKQDRMHWSQPEILLYAEDPDVRMSYPDLIEQDGRYWVTETQKSIARIHELDPELLEGTWAQLEGMLPGNSVRRGCVAECSRFDPKTLEKLELPRLTLKDGAGFTLDLWLTVGSFQSGKPLLDGRDESGKGWHVSLAEDRTISLAMSDGRLRSSWNCDPGMLREDVAHHIAFVVDGGPNIISVLVDGVLCDGAGVRQSGWGRFHPDLSDVSGSSTLASDSDRAELHRLRIYNRQLRTAEVVQNCRAGM